MTAAILSIALALSPHTAPLQVAPVASARSETVQPRAVVLPSTLARLDPTWWTDTALSLTFDGPAPTTTLPPELYPSDRLLAALRMCESTGNYAINTGNGFRGAYQYLQSTWNHAASINGRPDLVGVPVERVSPADQDAITRAWWNQSDYRQQWPVCGPRAVRAAA